ncbi:unnamed protein product [Amoebophrya sp. A120]|nr:unnamed protein product [Amoebophrya sp. A120]|eukprot:GSA120T00016926001.1
MLRQDKFLLAAHPDYLASEEETRQFIHHCFRNNLNLLAASFGYDQVLGSSTTSSSRAGGDHEDPGDIERTTTTACNSNYDGKNPETHPAYAQMFHTATRMLWQAKQEKPKNQKELLEKGEAWLRECLEYREQYRLKEALFDVKFNKTHVRLFRNLLGYGFSNRVSRKGQYAVLWTRFGYSDFAELQKLPLEVCARCWMRIWEYMGTVQMRHLSLMEGKIVDRVLLIVDLANMGVSALSWLRTFLKHVANHTRHLFPESMAHILIVNMHWLIRAPTNTLSRLFLNPATLYKFRFLSAVEELQEFLDVRDIPLYLNGKNADPLLNPDPVTGRLPGGQEAIWTQQMVRGEVDASEYLAAREPYDRHGGCSSSIVGAGGGGGAAAAAPPGQNITNSAATSATTTTSVLPVGRRSSSSKASKSKLTVARPTLDAHRGPQIMNADSFTKDSINPREPPPPEPKVNEADGVVFGDHSGANVSVNHVVDEISSRPGGTAPGGEPSAAAAARSANLKRTSTGSGPADEVDDPLCSRTPSTSRPSSSASGISLAKTISVSSNDQSGAGGPMTTTTGAGTSSKNITTSTTTSTQLRPVEHDVDVVVPTPPINTKNAPSNSGYSSSHSQPAPEDAVCLVPSSSCATTPSTSQKSSFLQVHLPSSSTPTTTTTTPNYINPIEAVPFGAPEDAKSSASTTSSTAPSKKSWWNRRSSDDQADGCSSDTAAQQDSPRSLPMSSVAARKIGCFPGAGTTSPSKGPLVRGGIAKMVSRSSASSTSTKGGGVEQKSSSTSSKQPLPHTTTSTTNRASLLLQNDAQIDDLLDKMDAGVLATGTVPVVVSGRRKSSSVSGSGSFAAPVRSGSKAASKSGTTSTKEKTHQTDAARRSSSTRKSSKAKSAGSSSLSPLSSHASFASCEDDAGPDELQHGGAPLDLEEITTSGAAEITRYSTTREFATAQDLEEGDLLDTDEQARPRVKQDGEGDIKHRKTNSKVSSHDSATSTTTSAALKIAATSSSSASPAPPQESKHNGAPGIAQAVRGSPPRKLLSQESVMISSTTTLPSAGEAAAAARPGRDQGANVKIRITESDEKKQDSYNYATGAAVSGPHPVRSSTKGSKRTSSERTIASKDSVSSSVDIFNQQTEPAPPGRGSKQIIPEESRRDLRTSAGGENKTTENAKLRSGREPGGASGPPRARTAGVLVAAQEAQDGAFVRPQRQSMTNLRADHGVQLGPQEQHFDLHPVVQQEQRYRNDLDQLEQQQSDDRRKNLPVPSSKINYSATTSRERPVVVSAQEPAAQEHQQAKMQNENSTTWMRQIASRFADVSRKLPPNGFMSAMSPSAASPSGGPSSSAQHLHAAHLQRHQQMIVQHPPNRNSSSRISATSITTSGPRSSRLQRQEDQQLHGPPPSYSQGRKSRNFQETEENLNVTQQHRYNASSTSTATRQEKESDHSSPGFDGPMTTATSKPHQNKSSSRWSFSFVRSSVKRKDYHDIDDRERLDMARL